MTFLEKHIYDLEEELMKPGTRGSAQRISELLSDDFTEFCSSGYVYHYKKGDSFEPVGASSQMCCEIKEFTIRQLSEDTILALYKLIKGGETGEAMRYSNRSSIWKCYDGKWKIIFHQGTPEKEI